jgi:hypothetical protein
MCVADDPVIADFRSHAPKVERRFALFKCRFGSLKESAELAELVESITTAGLGSSAAYVRI